MGSRLVGDCALHFYIGHIAPIDDPDPLVMAPGHREIATADVSGVCRDEGFLDQLDGQLRSMGLQDDVIGEVPVRRSATDIVVVDDDRVLHLATEDPATFVSMAPFINALVTGNVPPDVTDDTTLAVGTCLFRAPSETGRDEDRRTYGVDCGPPHQGEVFHRFDLQAPRTRATTSPWRKPSRAAWERSGTTSGSRSSARR